MRLCVLPRAALARCRAADRLHVRHECTPVQGSLVDPLSWPGAVPAAQLLLRARGRERGRGVGRAATAALTVTRPMCTFAQGSSHVDNDCARRTVRRLSARACRFVDYSRSRRSGCAQASSGCAPRLRSVCRAARSPPSLMVRTIICGPTLPQRLYSARSSAKCLRAPGEVRSMQAPCRARVESCFRLHPEKGKAHRFEQPV